MTNAELIRAMWDAVNEGGPERMREFLAENYIRRDADHEFTREEWVATLSARWEAFPDNHSNVVDVIEDGDKAAYRWEAVGRHRQTYERVPPTGKQVKAQGITISRFENGRIVEEWASWNKSSVLHALGVLPIA
ncbi:ester cyclase [Psychromarinibacter sp. C21-152]|uniref:Ester cyclase n=1 Tax=Psychromarinibacter sediminicola TaxID=3033385 RepID=A0AAE3NST2_9RHOB|nr:ester cyclase [Psychromarinibacter sediminicola]MDF0600989.1 ester cyclase [Psychromarinibacter sediminicola]